MAGAPPLRLLSPTESRFKTLVLKQRAFVDRTGPLADIFTNETRVFLSRPRKWGKTLTVSTIEALMTEPREFFSGLGAYDNDAFWAWRDAANPVCLRFDLSGKAAIQGPAALQRMLRRSMAKMIQRHNLPRLRELHADADFALDECFAAVVDAIETQRRKKNLPDVPGWLCVLIDEADKPVVDVLDANGGGERERAQKNLDVIKPLYEAMKATEALDRMFVTGVAKLSKAGLFSGANQLRDMTLTTDPHFYTLCGFTRADVVSSFAPHLEATASELGLSQDALLDKMERMYGGFRWTRKDSPPLMNPWSVTTALQERTLDHWWSTAGTPGWLPRVTSYEIARNASQLISKGEPVHNDVLNKIEISDLGTSSASLVSLLLQTGYATVTEYLPASQEWQLRWGSEDALAGFQGVLMPILTSRSFALPSVLTSRGRGFFRDGDIKGLLELFCQQVEHFPKEVLKEALKEAYPHAILPSHLRQLLPESARVESESGDITGRTDLRFQVGDVQHIVELKIAARATPDAMLQAHEEARTQAAERLGYDGFEGQRRNWTIVFPKRGSGFEVCES